MLKTASLIVLVFGSLTSPARAADQPRPVAVWDAMTFDSAKTGGAEHERIRAVLTEALGRAGWSLRSVAQPPGCDPRSICFQSIAAQHQIAHVVRLSGQPDSNVGFTVRAELYSAATRATSSITMYQDTWNLKNLAKALGQSTVDLLAEMDKRVSRTPDPAAPPSAIVLWDANLSTDHQAVHRNVVETLDRAAWSVREVAPPTCTNIDTCLANVATSSHARYALRLVGEGTTRDETTIKLELYSASTGTFHRSSLTLLLGNLLTTGKFSDIVAHAATELLATAAAGQPPAAGAAAKEPNKLVQASPTSSPKSRWIPWTLTAVGAAAILYGGIALYEDGKTTNATSISGYQGHRDRYSSTTVGASFLATGIASCLVAGVLFLIEPGSNTRVALSPSSVDLSVRF